MRNIFVALVLLTVSAFTAQASDKSADKIGSHSAANTGWFTVKVRFAGTQPGGVFLQATEIGSSPAFTNRLFKVDEAYQIEGLAIAMAAVSANKLMVIQSDVGNEEPGMHPRIISVFLDERSSLDH